MRLSSRIAVVAATGFATLGLASGAWGYFTASATASGAAHVGTVAPPTAVTATASDPGPATVHVAWTAAPPAGLALRGYYVERIAGSSPSPACGSSPAALLGPTATGCDDPAVAPGSYDYRVTAVFGTLTAPSASAPVTVESSTL